MEYKSCCKPSAWNLYHGFLIVVDVVGISSVLYLFLLIDESTETTSLNYEDLFDSNYATVE